jgi:hypothetical protein
MWYKAHGQVVIKGIQYRKKGVGRMFSNNNKELTDSERK